MKACSERRGTYPPILNLARDGNDWLTSDSGCFTPGKREPFPLNTTLGSPQSYSGHFEEEKYILPLTVFRAPDRPARSESLQRLRYLGSVFSLLLLFLLLFLWTWIAQSLQRLATGWTVRGLNPGVGGTRFSAPVQTCPLAHPASYKMGTRSLSRG